MWNKRASVKIPGPQRHCIGQTLSKKAGWSTNAVLHNEHILSLVTHKSEMKLDVEEAIKSASVSASGMGWDGAVLVSRAATASLSAGTSQGLPECSRGTF